MIPVHGFLEGDTLGILLLLDEHETLASVVEKAQRSSRLRVAPRRDLRVVHRGVVLELDKRVAETPIAALERIDVVSAESVEKEDHPP